MTRNKHQNADILIKKTEFYEKEEQRKADRPEIKDGHLQDDSTSHGNQSRITQKNQMNTSRQRSRGDETPGNADGILAQVETGQAKGYDIEKVERGRAVVGQESRTLLQKHVDTNNRNIEPKITIMRRNK